MLRRIGIRNYLLIEELELDLASGFTAITGETGSGKSILIGALGLAMGERATGELARDPRSKCIIEIECDLAGLGLEAWFVEQELPYEQVALLRRQFDPGGRGRAFINDTPVKLDQLRALGERLVHIHSQHHGLLLGDHTFQLGLVDHFAGQQAAVKAYGGSYRLWKAVQDELTALREAEARAHEELDHLQFQLVELDAAELKAEEQSDLELALARAEHGEELTHALRSLETGIDGDDGVLAPLNTLKQLIGKVSRLDAGALELGGRLHGVLIELKDIAAEAGRLASGVSLDPREAQRLRERLDVLLRLQRKHRLKDVIGLIALRDGLRHHTAAIGSLGDRIVELERKGSVLRAEVEKGAADLRAGRVKAMGLLAASVSGTLADLGMPHAVFTFMHQVVAPGPLGGDQVRAHFSADRDRAAAPIDQVASGGELSRVVLALIGLAAESRSLPTVVFDEIDTGVSGAVADRVGALMDRLARDRQVIAITHLPQIASKAKAHLLVSKDQHAEVVATEIRPLDGEERVKVLAGMLSGRRTTKAALDNARELLKGR